MGLKNGPEEQRRKFKEELDIVKKAQDAHREARGKVFDMLKTTQESLKKKVFFFALKFDIPAYI